MNRVSLKEIQGESCCSTEVSCYIIPGQCSGKLSQQWAFGSKDPAIILQDHIARRYFAAMWLWMSCTVDISDSTVIGDVV